jgi:hypothetical protein
MSQAFLFDVIGGATGGVISTLIIHPLDVVRTKVQTSNAKQYTNALDCVNKTYHADGVKGFYRGMAAPLLAQGLYKAVIFSSQGWAIRTLNGNQQQPKRIPIYKICIAGSFSGIVNAMVVTPVELIRNRLIVHSHYRNPMHCLTETIKNEGVFTLFKGFQSCALRDGPGVGAWFGAFEVAKRTISGLGIAKESDTSTILVSGACGGCAFWLVALPMDTVKSIIQTSNHVSLTNVVSDILRSRGIKGFYRGLDVAIARGIPAAAIVFLVNQRVTRYLKAQYM